MVDRKVRGLRNILLRFKLSIRSYGKVHGGGEIHLKTRELKEQTGVNPRKISWVEAEKCEGRQDSCVSWARRGARLSIRLRGNYMGSRGRFRDNLESLRVKSFSTGMPLVASAKG